MNHSQSSAPGPETGGESLETPEQRPRRPLWSRWGIWVGVLTVLLVVYLLPKLGNVPPARSWLLGYIVEGYPLEVSADSISLGWFAPVRLRGVEVNDEQGEPLLQAKEITLESTLLGLLFSRRDLGTIRLSGPTAHVIVREQTSNWQSLIDQVMAAGDEEEEGVAAEVSIDDGSIVVRDAVNDVIRSLAAVKGVVDYSPTPDEPSTLNLTATLDGPSSTLSVVGKWWFASPGSDQAVQAERAENTQGELALNIQQMPVSLLNPLVRRFQVAETMSGVVTGELKLQQPSPGEPLQLTILTLKGNRLRILNSSYVSEPDVLLDDFELQGVVWLQENEARWEKFVFRSELGRAAASGGIDFAQLSQGNLDDAILPHRNQLEATVDLVALTELLPETLQLRPGVTVNSGSAAVALETVDRDGQLSLQGVAQWDDLTVLQEEQLRALPPARIELVASSQNDRLVVESLEGAGDFFTLSGRGSRANGEFSAEVNLDQLRQELEGVVDLRGVRMSGITRAEGKWSEQTGNWTGSAEGSIRDWELTLPDEGVWRERQLRWSLSLGGPWREGHLQAIERATAEVSAEDDRLVVELTDTVDLNSESWRWPIRFEVVGEAADWQTRLAALFVLPGIDVRGRLDARGQATVAGDAIDWRNVTGQVRGLDVQTPVWSLTGLDGEAESSQGQYSLTGQSLRTNHLEFRSEPLLVEGSEVLVDLTGEVPVFTGSVTCRGDWALLDERFDFRRPEGVPPRYRFAGKFAGEARVKADQEILAGTVSFVSTDTALLYREPAAESGGGNEDAAAGARHDAADAIAQENGVADAVAEEARGGSPEDALPEDALSDEVEGAWEQVWLEEEASFEGKMRLSLADAAAELEEVSLLTSFLQMRVDGTIRDVTALAEADLKGVAEYDLSEFEELLRPYLGKDFEVSSRGKTQFVISGPLRGTRERIPNPVAAVEAGPQARVRPLVSPRLTASGQLAWQSATLYGLPLGESELTAKLADSTVQFSPLNVPLSDGRLQGDASILLFQPHAALRVREGRILDDVAITPSMCRTWLKYVAPLLADVTRIDGRLSLDLEDSRIVFVDPGQSDLGGTLHVSEGRVGPGPLSKVALEIAQRIQDLLLQEPIAALAGDDQVWLDLSRQRVPFALREGRVFHEDMQLRVGPVHVITSGSVGLDQTLALQAEVPVRGEWFADQESLAASFSGQSLRIPVTGTLSEPAIDNDSFQQFARESAQSAAGTLLREGLRRGLESLFGGGTTPETPEEPDE